MGEVESEQGVAATSNCIEWPALSLSASSAWLDRHVEEISAVMKQTTVVTKQTKRSKGADGLAEKSE